MDIIIHYMFQQISFSSNFIDRRVAGNVCNQLTCLLNVGLYVPMFDGQETDVDFTLCYMNLFKLIVNS
jgi:hypothetical protein